MRDLWQDLRRDPWLWMVVAWWGLAAAELVFIAVLLGVVMGS